MDRKTLLAVVISVVIIVAGMLITPLLSPPKPASAPAGNGPAGPVPGTRSRWSPGLGVHGIERPGCGRTDCCAEARVRSCRRGSSAGQGRAAAGLRAPSLAG